MIGTGMPTEESDQFTDVPSRPSATALYPWLLVAFGAASDTVSGKFHPAWLAGAGLILFAALYMTALWIRLRTERQRTSYVLLVALGAVGVALGAGFGGSMAALCPLLALCCGAIVPWRTRNGPPLPLVVVAGVAALGALIAWLRHAPGGDIWQVAYGSALAGLIVSIIFRFINAISELRRTREELAQSAVDAERLRFARDMHDLLGHTLSVMVVKAQVVRRLAGRDPEAATAQAADIEEIGRHALTEVRQAITGYRGRGLAPELAAAEAALTGAGFTVAVRQGGAELPSEVDALLGWVVREGVTNVIKHSGGHQCEIDVHHTDGEASVEIADDGAGAGGSALDLPSGGHGLAGLTERIAAAGGTVQAGPRRGGGFRLAAVIPVRTAA
jgi:two-component system sensor histidine kinase DesK